MSLTSLAIKVADLSIAGLFPLLAVLLLRFFWRRLPRRLMMLAWLIVALRLMVPISVQSPAGTVPAEATHVIQTLYQNALADTQPQNAALAPQAPAQEVSPSGFALSAALLSRLWLAGALGMLGYGALSLLRLYRRTACATPLEPGVFEWEGCTSPFILGLLRPRILMPYGMESRQRELVLLHERSHIRCLDHLKKPLAFFILSIHWFNPLVWIAFCAFCRDLEGACDERVIRGMEPGSRKAYSQTLLHFSAERSPLRCPVAFGETNIKDRILRVLNYKKPGHLLLVIGGIALVILAVCFLTNSPENRTSIGIIGGADRPTNLSVTSNAPVSSPQGAVPLDTVLSLAGIGYDKMNWSALDGYDYTVTSMSPYTLLYICENSLILEIQGDNQATQEKAKIQAVYLYYLPDQPQDLIKLDLPVTSRDEVMQYINEYATAFNWYPVWNEDSFTRSLPPIDFGTFDSGRLFYYLTPPYGYLTYSGVTTEEVLAYIEALQEAGFELQQLTEGNTILTQEPQLSTNAQLIKDDLGLSISHVGSTMTLAVIQQSE